MARITRTLSTVALVISMAACSNSAAANPTPANPIPAAVTTSAADDWQAFTIFAGNASNDIKGIFTSLSGLADAGEVDGVVNGSRSAETRINGYIDWLNEHPSSPCYFTVYSQFYAALTSYRSAFTSVANLDFDTAVSLMSDGTTSLDASTAAIESVSC